MKLIDYLVRTLPGIGGWKDRDINVVIDNTPIVINIKGDEAAGLIDGCSMLSITRAQYEAALAASQKVEWDGAGLPPVGCECEVMHEDRWLKCKVLVHTSFGAIDCAVCQTELSIYCKSEMNYRPLRSEADKKRDEAKHAIAELCRSSASNGHSADLIYDAIAAGKIPHIRIE